MIFDGVRGGRENSILDLFAQEIVIHASQRTREWQGSLGRPDALLLELCEERLDQLELNSSRSKAGRRSIDRNIVVDRIQVERDDGRLVDVQGCL